MSADAFAPLFAWLLEAEYPRLRQRLIALLSFWGSHSPEEAADETFTRVAAKLREGEVVRTESRLAYLRGVARFVFLEELRRREREQAARAQSIESPSQEEASEKLDCLEQCLRKLDPDTRALVVDYYRGQERERIERREQIAKRLGIGVGPLRNRLQRLREKLRRCTEDCLRDTKPPEGPLDE